MTQGFKQSQGLLLPESAQNASLIEQLCTYSQHAIIATLLSGQKPSAPVLQRKLHARSQTAAVPVSQQRQQHGSLESQAEVQSARPDGAPVQALVTPIMELAVSVLTTAIRGTEVSVLLRPVKLAHSLLDVVQQQGSEVAVEHVDAMVGDNAVIGKLR